MKITCSQTAQLQVWKGFRSIERSMLNDLKRFVTMLAAATSLVTPVSAQVRPPADEQLAGAVTDFSSNACYGIASGQTVLPAANDQSPAALDRTIKAVEQMGLGFGIENKMFKALGTLGQTLISRSTMGSKSLDHGDVVVTFSGPMPGCKVILLTEAPIDITDGLSSNLTSMGWKAVPSMTSRHGTLERRAFVKRDAKGHPYLMNLMIVGDPDLKLRLITTTIRIPAGVTLPPGL